MRIIGIILCLLLAVGAALLSSAAEEGVEAGKMSAACAGFSLLMLHACYRLYRYRKTGNSPWDDLAGSSQKPGTTLGLVGAFFHPGRMLFRTSLSLFLLLLLGLFASAAWFWAFFLLLAVGKAALLFQYCRYVKAWQLLCEAGGSDSRESAGEPTDETLVHTWMEKLRSLERQAIELHLDTSRKATAGIGSSKWGGQPDVPGDFQWPVDDDQRPLSHLLQINCADLAPHDPEGLLPGAGYLYFFYELSRQNGEDTRHSVRVIYRDSRSDQLHRADYPHELQDEGRLREWPVSLSSRKSYPSPGDITGGEPDARILAEHAAAWEAARARLLPDSEPLGTMLGYAEWMRDGRVTTGDDTILLLQLFSRLCEDAADDVMFGDAGSISFFISRRDLQDRRFERIVFELQCS